MPVAQGPPIPWQSLTQVLTDKPLILAGPLLRRVRSDSVTVWLALRARAEVTLEIYSVGEGTTTVTQFSGTAKTIRVGRNLHLVTLTARASAATALRPNTTYLYGLRFSTAEGPKSLSEALGANDCSSIAYPPHPLPSFSLPPAQLTEVRLIQGSCRKPNGDGEDALAHLDTLLASSAGSPTDRPHQLLLTGDQIYADEVAEVLLLMLTDAAQALLVDEETMTKANGEVVFPQRLLPASRVSVVKLAGFTTEDARSHLLSFGEYLAMYLFAWSDVLWPQQLPTHADLTTRAAGNAELLKLLSELKGQIETARLNVEAMRSVVAKVRRALANIPSYMILDDHDVSDDWNMTQEFCEQVYGNPIGMRVAQNALLAYALCQHWGNVPEQFEAFQAPAGRRLLTLLEGAAKYDDIANNPDLLKMLGLHQPADPGRPIPFAVYHDVGTRTQLNGGIWIDTASLLYHYTIETPAYQIIVTDTRTWREFPRGGVQSPPNLIATAQLQTQINNTPALNGRLLLVVVSTNMPPSPSIRQGARDLTPLSETFRYEDFFDGWEIERVDYARALAALSCKFPRNAQGRRQGALVLLSGDVHASSAQRIAYTANLQLSDIPEAQGGADLVLAQLVGSALHNQAEKTLGQHANGYSYVPLKAKLLQQQTLLTEGFLGWNPALLSTPRIGSSVVAGSITTYPAEVTADHPIWTTRVESSFAALSALSEITVPPHFRLRLDYIKATAGSRYEQEPLLIKLTDLLGRAAERVRLYQRYAHQVRSGREMVGKNNLGEIRFRRAATLADPTLTVLYTVHWPEGTAVDYVRFEVSLDGGDPRYPALPDPH